MTEDNRQPVRPRQAGLSSASAARRAAAALAREVGVFSQHALPSPLREYQLEVARAVVRSILSGAGLTFTVLFPRQAGKNELSAQLEAFLLFRYQRCGGALVKAAPTFRPQLVNSMLRLERLLDGPLTHGRWRKQHGYLYQLGRASCAFFSAQPGASIVGATASLLLEGDEAQDLDPAKWDRDLVPMAATANATRVLYGTPWTDDTLLAREIRRNLELQARDGLRRHFQIGWETVAAAVPAYGRHVQAEIARLGPTHPIVRTQYLLQPLARADRLLSQAQLALLRGEHPPQLGPAPGPWGPGVYVAGLDVAGQDEEDPEGVLVATTPRRDATVLAIAFAEAALVPELAPTAATPERPAPRPAVLEPRLSLVRLYAWRGRPHRQLYPELLALVRDHWRCQTVVVDATGIGSGLAAFLGAALGPRVVRPYLYTAASKSTLAYDFLAAVNAGRFKLHAPTPETPELGELLQQAAAAEYRLRPNQQLTFFVPEHRGHDDLLNAVALLVQAAPLRARRVATGRQLG